MNTLVDYPFLPFSKPSICESSIEEVAECLRSGWITTGPRTQRFEEMLKDYLVSEHALTCSSATAGLFMALKTLDLEPGDEVVTISMTFAASLKCIVNAEKISEQVVSLPLFPSMTDEDQQRVIDAIHDVFNLVVAI